MENKIKIGIRSVSGDFPIYGTPGSAGCDIKAYLSEDIIIAPQKRAVIPTGVHISLPEGYEAQLRSRSGLTANYGIIVLNAPGTIDSDYRGEIKVIVLNAGESDFTVSNGMKIAQMVVSKFSQAEWIEFNSILELGETQRGDKGFGSTGI